jgi:hypothetical protein
MLNYGKDMNLNNIFLFSSYQINNFLWRALQGLFILKNLQ